MAAGAASQIIRAPGRLVAGPTDLQLAFPHGGVAVGRTRLVALVRRGAPYVVACEGLGGEASDVLEGPGLHVLTCFLRGWDDDAVERFFATNYVQGATSGHALLREPGERTPGRSALERALVLLFEPDDPIHAPAVLVHRGVPSWSEGAEIAWQRGDELGIPLAVECVTADNGKTVEVGRLADMTLI